MKKSKTSIWAIIPAAGIGTRMGSIKPKQYLNLLGEKSLLKQTIDRLEGFTSFEDTFVVTVKDQERLELV